MERWRLLNAVCPGFPMISAHPQVRSRWSQKQSEGPKAKAKGKGHLSFWITNRVFWWLSTFTASRTTLPLAEKRWRDITHIYKYIDLERYQRELCRPFVSNLANLVCCQVSKIQKHLSKLISCKKCQSSDSPSPTAAFLRWLQVTRMDWHRIKHHWKRTYQHTVNRCQEISERIRMIC